MKTIYKYELIPSGNTIIVSMPKDSKLLHIHEQRGDMFIWAMVDTDNEVEDRQFKIFGTGHEIPKDDEHLLYIGTVHLNHLELVFHVFEILNNNKESK